jgi:hypothetical protein
VPLDPAVREWADKGTPVVQAMPESTASRVFLSVADRLVERVEAMNSASVQATPVIDRSGGDGGHKRLPVIK